MSAKIMSIRVMSEVWERADSEGGELLVLLAIADFCNDKGYAWPSVEVLAKKARLKERQTQYCLKNLMIKGLLEVQKNEGPHGVNLYRVTVPGAENAPVQSMVNGGAVDSTHVVQPIAPKPSLNRQEPSVHKRDLSKGSLEEVKAYCLEQGLPDSDGEWFFYKCQGCGWTNGGKPIRDWQATIRAWKTAGYLPSQKHSLHKHSQYPFKPPYKTIVDDAQSVIENFKMPDTGLNEP